ncbi:Chorismate synthase [Seminavis robusta]|uniref:Chorismate synthase n=1 Tax=Seminavis robusta TaxID=568900 RepID=A0A9N8DBZ6_9STRA|nr:Chorismate synthase [Seminavis robusta]|eukprot:Sro11_g008840.1 Chorismate synthase (436) ;mRNA; f:169986-171433
MKTTIFWLASITCLPSSAWALSLYMGTGNTFGRTFRISTFGESHGGGVGVTVDGCPPRIPLTREEIQKDLDRRRPGQSRITTPRNEADAVEILSGLSPDGITIGTPIGMLVRNKDQRSQDYMDNDMKVAYRPSHADATYDAKYGVRAIAGGGRSSARETIGRVAAGAIARKILKLYNNIEILGYVSKVQDIECQNVDDDTFTMEQVDANIVRCPDPESAERMLERIDSIRKDGNSIGGVVTCVARNVPAGLGSPVFDKLEADLAKACMSIPAAKGFESGSGFAGTLLTGKEHNDEFYIDPETGATRTKTNRSGGIQGGISNGENVVIRVAFKPTSTIGKEQNTVTRDGTEVSLRGKGRHDPCVLPRAIPMVEAMVAITLLDALMMQQAQCELFPNEAEDINPMGTSVVGRAAPAAATVGGHAEAPKAVDQRIDEE